MTNLHFHLLEPWVHKKLAKEGFHRLLRGSYRATPHTSCHHCWLGFQSWELGRATKGLRLPRVQHCPWKGSSDQQRCQEERGPWGSGHAMHLLTWCQPQCQFGHSTQARFPVGHLKTYLSRKHDKLVGAHSSDFGFSFRTWGRLSLSLMALYPGCSIIYI